MFRNFGPGEILVLVLLLVIVLGWKKLPDAARSVGRSMRIFKSEVDEMKHDGKSAASSDTVSGNVVTGTSAPTPSAVPPPAPMPSAGAPSPVPPSSSAADSAADQQRQHPPA